MDALLALHELRAAPGLSDLEVAKRARAILDRSDLAELDLVGFLQGHGLAGAELARAAAAFGKAAAAAYRAQYGVEPHRAARWIDDLRDWRSVNTYLETDRELLEVAFAAWSAGVTQ